MGFKKAKPTFLSQAGRQGAPTVLKPKAEKNTKATAKKHASSTVKKNSKGKIGKASVVKNGAPLKTGKVSKNVNANTGKGFSLTGKASVDQRLSNYFMSKSPKLTSATNSPQTAPQAFKPRG